MTIDLEQFHQVFFEESFEGLDIMESSLMELDPSDVDSETINAIFRCAHSIKGGSATFGFSSIAEFTHVLETLLDQVRSGARGVNLEEVNLYLKSVDCMREMLALIRDGEEGTTELSQSLRQSFSALLENDSAVPECSDKDQDLPSEADSVQKTWHITFTPFKTLFLSGNDPYRNLQVLSELGKIVVTCHTKDIPTLSELNPEHSYMSWEIELVTDVDKQDLLDVFEWVEGDCDLSISEFEVAQTATDAINTSKKIWQIEFSPSKDILRTGNEPARILEGLARLGQITMIECDRSNLPDLHSLDSENCYLSWLISLETDDIAQADIESVFEWVQDDADITISAQTSPEQALQAEKVEHENRDTAAVSTSVKQKNAAPVTQRGSNARPKSTAKKSTTESASIRVGIDKVDNLINMVGELVITQSMLGQLGTDFDIDRIPKLMEGLGQLEQNTRELQESVMKIRMLPISFAFSRFPRMIRDLSQTLGKSVELEMRGENTELDKTVMEKIGDPLVHLVRNAVDHGIETPDVRSSQGKDPTGKITLNAFHQSGNVVIEIIDDGKGLDPVKITEKAIEKNLISEKDIQFMSDEQVYDLIFQPGFSTAQTVSDVSGRGVGMDVVKKNIQALNGVVEISSTKGQGSKITIKLPLTLAILDGQLVRVGHHTYIFPLVSIIESLQCKQEYINCVAGGCSVFKLRDDYVPIIQLHKSFSVEPDSLDLEDSLLVVVESEGEKVGIVVDELLAQQQVVIKSLEENYRRVDGISGATILGDGTVALILDMPGIIKLSADQVGISTDSLGRIIHHHDMLNAASYDQRTVVN